MPRNLSTFKIEGAKDLERSLFELSEAAGNGRSGKAAMRRAALKALEPFVKAWQRSAPVLSGRYRERIVTGSRLNARQSRLVKREGKSNLEVYAGTDDPAGVHQEFGTAHHPAQPSGRPAWDETQLEVLDTLQVEAWAQLRKTAERLSRKLARRR